jgi:predicted ATPase
MSDQTSDLPVTAPASTELDVLRQHLQRLHRTAGEPSTREIAKRTHGGISHTTVAAVLRCAKNPRWGQVELVVEALGGDTEVFRPWWIAAQDAIPGVGTTPAPVRTHSVFDVAFLVTGRDSLTYFLRHLGAVVTPVGDRNSGDTVYAFAVGGSRASGSAIVSMIGDEDSTDAVTRLLARHRPRLLVMIGSATADDPRVGRGDVVVATTVHGPSGPYACSPRPLTWARNFTFAHAHRFQTWQADVRRLAAGLLPGAAAPPSRLHDGPVRSASTVSAPDATGPCLAVDRAPAAAPASAIGNGVDVMVVRGISHLLGEDAGGGAGPDDAARTELAMASATLLVTTLLAGTAPASGGISEHPLAGGPGTEATMRNSFVGRADTLRQLEQLFAEDSAIPLVTVTGEGGIGKTRLAQEFVRGAGPLFPEGVHWVDLGSNFEIGSVEEAIARAVGAEGVPASQDALIAVLRIRRGLLVLDNFESVTSRIPLVRRIVQECPSLRVLVTSRTRLQLPGEHTIRLDPLSHDIDAPESEAASLFRARITESTGTREWSSTELATIAEVCHLVEGVPLALELVASQADHIGVADMLRLVSDGGAGPQHPTSVSAVRMGLDRSFASSIDDLTAAQQALLKTVSYFGGSASLAALGAVHAIAGEELVQDVGVLVNRSLLRAAFDAAGTSRYSLLAPLREHVDRRPWADGTGSAVKAGHARYFVDLAWRAREHLYGPAQARWLDAVESDVWNFRIAHDVMIRSGGLGDAMKIQGGLTRFWLVRDFLTMGEELAENIAAADPRVEPSDEWAEWSLSRGLLAWLRGRPDDADHILDTVVRYGETAGSAFYQANGLANRGLVAADVGRLAEARAFYADGELRAQQAGDSWNRAICVSGIASVQQREGDLEAALASYLQGLDLFRGTGDTWSLARILRRVLSLAVDLADDALITTVSAEARAMSDVVKDAHSEAEVFSLLARRDEAIGQDWVAVRGYFEAAASYARLGRTSLAKTQMGRATSVLLRRQEGELAGRADGIAAQLLPEPAGTQHEQGPELPTLQRLAYNRGFSTGARDNPLAGIRLLAQEVAGRSN